MFQIIKAHSHRDLISLIILCFGLAAPLNAEKKGKIYQISTIDALLAGHYDGVTTAGELLKHGDTGLGTFHGLDGELIMLKGNIYQITQEGRVISVPKSMGIPFAMVHRFKRASSFALKTGLTFPTFKSDLSQRFKEKNRFLVVIIEGTFTALQTRVIPRQKKPYPPLAQVVNSQPIFTFKDIKGTMVCIRGPNFIKGISIPGDHCHFISAKKDGGGHVQSFIVKKAKATVSTANKFLIDLPENPAFQHLDLRKERLKRKGELKKVEK